MKFDYTLHSAQKKITLLGFSRCFGSQYSVWRPIEAFGEPSGAVPSHCGRWIAQNVLGSNYCSKKQAKTVMVTDRVAVYGIYEADTDELGWIVLYDVFSVGG